MRTLKFAAIAAFVAAGTLSAVAAEKKTAAASCKSFTDETSCAAPSCEWKPATTTKKGKEKKAYCAKVAKAKKKAA